MRKRASGGGGGGGCCFSVPEQLVLGDESLGAAGVGAAVGSLAGVRVRVHLQLLQTVESFLAVLAGEIPFGLCLAGPSAPPRGRRRRRHRRRLGFGQGVSAPVALGSGGHGASNGSALTDADTGALPKGDYLPSTFASSTSSGLISLRETERDTERKR